MAGSITIRVTGQALTLAGVTNQKGVPVGVFSDDRLTKPLALPATLTGDTVIWLFDGPVTLAVTDSMGRALSVDPAIVAQNQPRIVTPVPTMAQLAASTAMTDARSLTLQQLTSDYQAQLAASQADRQALHGQVDQQGAQLLQLTGQLAQLTAQIAAEVQTRTASDQAIAALQQAMAALQAAKVEIRTASPALPLLAAAGNTDLPVTWSTAMPSATYTVLGNLVGATSVLGKLQLGVKPGSQTKTGVTLTVSNSGLVAIAAAAGNVNVLAYTGPS